MKRIVFAALLSLAGCSGSPLEPEALAVDICMDTFSPAGGRTFTFRAGEQIPDSLYVPYQIKIEMVTLDSTLR
jgi:hypothetical protein